MYCYIWEYIIVAEICVINNIRLGSAAKALNMPWICEW